jgi:hypothetical protein
MSEIEAEADELKDEVGELETLRSFQASKRASKSRIRILKVEDDETTTGRDSQAAAALDKRIGVDRASLAKLENLVGASNKSDTEAESDEGVEEDEFQRRVRRFLSVVELPQESLYDSVRAPPLPMREPKKSTTTATPPSLLEKVVKEDEKNKKKPKDTNKVANSSKKSKKPMESNMGEKIVVNLDDSLVTTKNNKIRSYRNGTGLTQENKARIIKEIIRNYDLSSYVGRIKNTGVVECKIDKK